MTPEAVALAGWLIVTWFKPALIEVITEPPGMPKPVMPMLTARLAVWPAPSWTVVLPAVVEPPEGATWAPSVIVVEAVVEGAVTRT